MLSPSRADHEENQATGIPQTVKEVPASTEWQHSNVTGGPEKHYYEVSFDAFVFLCLARLQTSDFKYP